MKPLVFYYDKCSTCKKALKWLDEHEVSYEGRAIREAPPTVQELTQWIGASGLPIKRFFNTSGNLYKEKHLKDKLPDLSPEEQIALLASDGMLVKRPLLISDAVIWPGFKEAEWEKLLS